MVAFCRLSAWNKNLKRQLVIQTTVIIEDCIKRYTFEIHKSKWVYLQVSKLYSIFPSKYPSSPSPKIPQTLYCSNVKKFQVWDSVVSLLSPVLFSSVNSGVVVMWERNAQLKASAERGACEGWGTGKVPPRGVFKPDGGIPRRLLGRKAGCGGGDRHGKSPWEKQGTFSKLERAREVISSVQLLSRVWLFVTPWTAACQASLSIINSWSLLEHKSIKSAVPCNHLIAQWMKGRAAWDGQEPDPAETSRSWITKNVKLFVLVLWKIPLVAW